MNLLMVLELFSFDRSIVSLLFLMVSKFQNLFESIGLQVFFKTRFGLNGIPVSHYSYVFQKKVVCEVSFMKLN